MSTSARLLIIVGLVVGVSSFAGAEQVSYTSNTVQFGSIGTGLLTIQKFDPASFANGYGPATLNSVTLVFRDQGQVRIRITVPSMYQDDDDNWITNTSVTGRGEVQRNWSVAASQVPGAATGFTTNRSQLGNPFNLPPGTGEVPTPRYSETIAYGTPTYSDAYIYSGLNPDLYSGTGTIGMNVDVNAYANVVNASGGNFTVGYDNSWLNIRAEVIYDYSEATPEPASLALLPMMLGGLMFWRRRRAA